MSNIFDALKRSENEQRGSDSSRPAKATELLQRAERRAVSNWGANVSDVGPEAISLADNKEVVARDTIPPAEAVAAAPGNVERLSAGERSEILNRFQSLPISLPSQSRIVCLTDKESPTAEAIRLLGVRLRDLASDPATEEGLNYEHNPARRQEYDRCQPCLCSCPCAQRKDVVGGRRPAPSVSVADVRHSKVTRHL